MAVGSCQATWLPAGHFRSASPEEEGVKGLKGLRRSRGRNRGLGGGEGARAAAAVTSGRFREHREKRRRGSRPPPARRAPEVSTPSPPLPVPLNPSNAPPRQQPASGPRASAREASPFPSPRLSPSSSSGRCGRLPPTPHPFEIPIFSRRALNRPASLRLAPRSRRERRGQRRLDFTSALPCAPRVAQPNPQGTWLVAPPCRASRGRALPTREERLRAAQCLPPRKILLVAASCACQPHRSPGTRAHKSSFQSPGTSAARG